MKVITEINKLFDIPYLFFYPEEAKNRPLVIIGHGFNNDKYECSDIAIKLASNGVCSLCFDLYKQGERYDGFLENISNDTEFGFSLFNIICKSNDDLTKIINYFKQNYKIDSSKIGVLGISLGANLCFYALANNKDLQFAVPILGSPDFTNSLIYSMEKESEFDFKSQEEITLLEFVKSIDPYENLVKNEERFMFIINGTNDEDIPSRFSEEFYNKVKLRSELLKSKIELMVTDGGHYVTNEMKEKSINWIVRNFI